MRYISREELESYPSWRYVEQALYFGSLDRGGHHGLVTKNPTHKSPWTRDGFLSVQGLRNIRDWANWKSSSISNKERELSGILDRLASYHLLYEVNEGRKGNQAALFPDGYVVEEGEERKALSEGVRQLEELEEDFSL